MSEHVQHYRTEQRATKTKTHHFLGQTILVFSECPSSAYAKNKQKAKAHFSGTGILNASVDRGIEVYCTCWRTRLFLSATLLRFQNRCFTHVNAVGEQIERGGSLRPNMCCSDLCLPGCSLVLVLFGIFSFLPTKTTWHQ